LSARPARPGSWADVDGDGQPEFIYLERIPGAGTGPGSDDRAKVVVWSMRDRNVLWSVALRASMPRLETWTISPPQWPVIADLDGDGAAELIVPDGSSSVTTMKTFVEVPWGEVVVLEGRSGTPRWRQQIVNCDQQIDRMVVGPDIDGDGHRELYVASLANLPVKLYIEARSGKTGELLWLSPHTLRADARLQDRFVGTPHWWNAGEDGWPQLIVTVHGESVTPMETDTILVSAATGRLTRKRQQLAGLQSRDVDHDGVEDLIAYRASDLAHPEDGGTVDCLRGMAAEPWNRIGPEGIPAADFNGDGSRDLLRVDLAGGVAAICGRSGATIWHAAFGPAQYFQARALDASTIGGGDDLDQPAGGSLGDIDGDGTVDVLFWLPHHFGPPTAPLGILSGRSGAVLWRATELPIRISDGLNDFRVADLDRDGVAELIVIMTADVGYPQNRRSFSSDDLQSWLVVFSSRTGAIRWQMPLSCAYGTSAPSTALLPPAGTTGFPVRTYGQIFRLLEVADLDTDGKWDVVAPAINPTGKNLEIHAYRGADGTQLWKHPLPLERQMHDAIVQLHPVRAADLEQDGKAEVLVLERDPVASPTSSDVLVPRLCVLDGASGTVRWRNSGEQRVHEYQPFQQGERRGITEVALPRVAGGTVVPTILFTGPKPQFMTCRGPDQVTTTSLETRIEAATLWCCDVDDDGTDEIALVVAGEIWLVSPDSLAKPRWKRGSTTERYARILEARSATPQRPAEIVAVRVSGDNSVVGLDAATGQPRWICAGPIPRERQAYVAPQMTALLDVDPLAPQPHVLFQHGQTTHCRQAVRARRGDQGQRSESLEVAFVSRPLETWSSALAPDSFRQRSTSRDPRWARDLPWVAHAGSSSELYQFLWRAGGFSLTLIILPASYLLWMVRKRQWGLRTMFVLPAIAGVMILMTTNDWFGQSELNGWERWGHGLLVTPPLLLLGRLVLWLVRRQWRRSVVWIAVMLAVSLVLGSVQLLLALRVNPLQPDEYFVTEQWYFILDVGFYLTSLVALPVVEIENWLRRRKGNA